MITLHEQVKRNHFFILLVGVVKMAKQFSTYPTKMARVPRNGVRSSNFLNMLWIKKLIALWSTSLTGKFLNL